MYKNKEPVVCDYE